MALDAKYFINYNFILMQFFYNDDLLKSKALMFDKDVIYSRFFLF